MNTFLWILQSCLAFIFLMAGSRKAFQSREKLLQFAPALSHVPIILPRLRVLEILGGVAMLLPGLLNIYPSLTGIAAICLCLVMLGAIILHAQRKEYKMLPMTIILFVLAASVAYLRLKGI